MNLLKSIVVAITLLLAGTSSAQAKEQRVFNQVSKNSGITSVYISPAAMRLGLSLMQGDNKTMEMIDLISNPGGMEVVSASTAESVSLLREECVSIIKSLNLVTFVNTEEDNESVNIYVGETSGDKKVRDILIETSTQTEYVVVYIRGDIDIDSFINK